MLPSGLQVWLPVQEGQGEGAGWHGHAHHNAQIPEGGTVAPGLRHIMPHIARGLFNAFAANFARDVTSEARASKDSSSGDISSRKRISSVGSHPNIEEGQEEEDVAAQSRDRESYKLRKLTGQHKWTRGQHKWTYVSITR